MVNYQSLTLKQQKRYDRIVNHAKELMLNEGFYKLSLSELTQKLRVSRSTIYENFGSKEGLVAKVLERYNEQLNHGLAAIMDDPELSTYERFLAISNQLAENSPSRKIYKFYNDLKIHLPELYQQHLADREERINLVYRPLIAEGIKNRLFDETLPEDFLLQTYLQSSRMVCETNMMESSNLGKMEAMNIVTRIFLNGAKSLEQYLDKNTE